MRREGITGCYHAYKNAKLAKEMSMEGALSVKIWRIMLTRGLRVPGAFVDRSGCPGNTRFRTGKTISEAYTHHHKQKRAHQLDRSRSRRGA